MKDITMDSAVQCPVCTLYLHEGMALSAHLDTHPKDQVINALCSLAAPPSGPAATITSPSPVQAPLVLSTPSTTPAPPPYSHHDHTHRPRPRMPYTPLPTPSTTPVSFATDHPVYFLPQTPRTYSRHGDNSSFSNNKFSENDGLIMAFVQPPVQEQDLVSIPAHQQYESKPPMHLVMPVKNPQPMFYKQLTHQVSVKKYVSAVPLLQQRPSEDQGVVVVVGESKHQPIGSASTSTSSVDVNKGDSNTCSSSKSGVKILSNIKVELPIQTIPDIIDLTSTQHRTQRPDLQEDEAILPDFVDAEMCHNYTQTRFRDHYTPQGQMTSSSPSHKLSQCSTAASSVVNTFSVIKNIGNPNLYKDTSQHSDDNKTNDNSILPDLTCNENPSISPCSELTNHSNEASYERISGRLTSTPIAVYQNRFSTCDAVTTVAISPKSKNKSLKIIPSTNNQCPSSSANHFNLEVSIVQSNERTDVCDNGSQPQDVARLDGFFKEFERKKHLVDASGQALEESKLNNNSNDCKSLVSSIDDEDSASCGDISKDLQEDRSMCSIENTFNSNFKNCLERNDTLKNTIDECAMGVDKLIDNLTQKSYTEMENMRPVNVIAFGSMLPNNATVESHGASTSYQDIAKGNCTSPHKYIMHEQSLYGEYFNKDGKQQDGNMIWEAHTQKEEFALTTFMDMGQGQYSNNAPHATTDGDGLQSYTEVVTSGSKPVEDSGRGEISEHDTPWPGMYCDVGGSTSYDLLARETWHSDGSDVDMPLTPVKDTYNDSEDIPIVVGVKPPERNYRCGTCGKTFNCPKERRVHRAKEHPITPNPDFSSSIDLQEQQGSLAVTVRKNKKKTVGALLKPVQIKHEVVKTEVASTNKEDIIEGGSEPVGLGLSFEDKKPKLEDVSMGLGEPEGERLSKKRKREWVCGTCKQEFPGQQEYNVHLKEHPLECLTCGKYFYRRSNMQLHIKRHLGIKNYKCEVCEKGFITKQKMLEHYYVHTGNMPIKCGLCPETFRRHSNMVQHRNKHHFLLKKKLRDYVCQCGEVFHSKKKLAWHKEIHEERPKACPHCSEKFIHAASLSRHMRRAHNTVFAQGEGGNAECTICHQVYLRTSLESHMRTHGGARPYSCHICNKAFTTKWNLKLHRWTHANRSSKPYKCSLCKGAFIRHADYVSHMNSHKSVRPYTCNYCGCQFIRKYNCQRHVKEHENDKKFACQVADCGKSFHRSYYLAEHMRVHSGHRPFACNICGKTSSTKSNHNKHVKIHHAREPVTTEG